MVLSAPNPRHYFVAQVGSPNPGTESAVSCYWVSRMINRDVAKDGALVGAVVGLGTKV